MPALPKQNTGRTMTAIAVVIDAAERHARELLNQASGYEQLGMQPIAEQTLRDHYEPLRDAIAEVRPSEPRQWNFAAVDTDRSSGFSNHTYCLQVAFVGNGDTPEIAYRQAANAGQVPDGLEPDELTVWPLDAEHVFAVPASDPGKHPTTTTKEES
jgi:hypothetical protein